jgi:hypothetical protein
VSSGGDDHQRQARKRRKLDDENHDYPSTTQIPVSTNLTLYTNTTLSSNSIACDVPPITENGHNSAPCVWEHTAPDKAANICEPESGRDDNAECCYGMVCLEISIERHLTNTVAHHRSLLSL